MIENKKDFIRETITNYSEKINNKKFHEIFLDLAADAKIIFLEFLLNFMDRNELLGLIKPFKANNQEILDVVENVLDYFKYPFNNFIFLDEVIKYQLDIPDTDTESKKAYASALHLIGIPEIYDVAYGMGFVGSEQDYLISDGRRSLSKWIDEQNKEVDADLKLSDFRKLW